MCSLPVYRLSLSFSCVYCFYVCVSVAILHQVHLSVSAFYLSLVAAMFGHYCHVVVRGDGSSTTIRSSLQPGVYQEHVRQRPLWAFDLPMDGLSRTGGTIQCSEADALQQAADSGLGSMLSELFR